MMVSWLKRILAPPVFDDEENTYIAAVLNSISLTLLGAAVFLLINNLLAPNPLVLFWIGFAALIILGAMWLMRRGHLTMARIVVPLVLFTIITIIVYDGHGIHDISVISYAIVIVLVSLLFGRQAPLIAALACFSALAGMVYIEINNDVPTDFQASTSLDDVINIGIILGVIGFLLRGMVGSLTDSLQRARQNEQTLAENNRQLQSIQTSLEKEIGERKRSEVALEQSNLALARRVEELAILNQITQTASAKHELQTVLETIAKSTTQLFDCFSTGISLFDMERGERTIVAWYSSQNPDQAIGMRRVYPITAEVPTAQIIHKRQSLLIENPQTNPLTADVHPVMRARGLTSLMIIPLLSRAEVIGAISIATNTLDRQFTPAEMKLAETVAGQIAGTIENARLFSAAQQEIAERTQAEIALAQARDQAIDASRIKSELLAKVSHELRTPLGAILGYTELMQEGLYGPVSEKQKEAIDEVIDSTHYLTNIVNELLDQAKLETGGIDLQIVPFSPADLVKQVCSKMQILAQSKGLDLQTELAEDMPSTLYGDPSRLQQILMNLVSNGIKFTDEGVVRVWLYCPDPTHWAIRVSDSGSGIPLESQTYIFEPFRQVDGSVTRPHVGTGLGLSIVQQLTRLMQGHIFLESEVGQGSAFTITFPHLRTEDATL